MKVRVIKTFIDRHTKDLHRIDDEFVISKERFEEINSTALGVFVEEIKEEKPIAKKKAKK